MEMILNTIRMVDNDQTKEYYFGDEKTLKEKLTIGLINPLDYKKLNLSPNYNLKLISNFGKLIIKPIEEKDVPIGTIVMPLSIWANQITGIVNYEIAYKNIKVKAEKTEDQILDFNELINSIKE